MEFILLSNVAAAIKKSLGIEKLKVAIVAEKAAWVDPIVAAGDKTLPEAMGMEVVGTWRPSSVANDCTAELTAIQRSGDHIIFTTFSFLLDLTLAKQLGELKVQAAAVSINVAPYKSGFWDATGSKGEYTLTVNTLAGSRSPTRPLPSSTSNWSTSRSCPTTPLAPMTPSTSST